MKDVSELISPENVEHKDVYKRQEVPFSLRSKEKDHSDQETIAYHNKGDNVIVLMDLNRRFMDTEASFVNKKVRTIPCGSIQKAKSVIPWQGFQLKKNNRKIRRESSTIQDFRKLMLY